MSDAWKTSGPTKFLDIDKIAAEGNIRELADDLTDLASSIIAVHTLSGGHKYLLEPVHVVRAKRDDGKQFLLRYGFRRFAALKSLYEKDPVKYVWAKKVPALVDEDVYDELKGADVAYKLVENIQRTQMNPMDEAYAISRLIEEAGVNQTEAAKMLGKSKGWITQRLQLLGTDATVQSAVQDGKLGPAAAREMVRIPKESQRKIMEEMVEEPASVADLSARVQEERETISLGDPSLAHEEKLRLIRERAASRGDAPIEVPAATPAVAATAAREKYEKAMQVAMDKNDKLRAAFYAGVVQGLECANEGRSRVVFPSELKADT